MAWIESHQELERHPKTHVLMGEMGWCVDVAIGKLHRFWWWALNYGPTGDIGKFNDAVLAGSVGLASSDGGKFKAAMLKACWLERRNGTLLIHDWRDYAGRYLKETKFKDKPEKWDEVCTLYPKERDLAKQKEAHGKSMENPRYQPDQPTGPTNQPASVGLRLSGSEERAAAKEADYIARAAAKLPRKAGGS